MLCLGSRAVFLSLCVWQRMWSNWFSQAVSPGYSSLRLSSFIAYDPSFLLRRQCPRSGFGFAETCSLLGISPDRSDMLSSKQDANTANGVVNPTRCVESVKRCCANEPVVNTSAICCAVHLFNLNRFLKIDATKHPFKISSVSSGNVSHARAHALFFILITSS